jgi:hypothetical protein
MKAGSSRKTRSPVPSERRSPARRLTNHHPSSPGSAGVPPARGCWSSIPRYAGLFGWRIKAAFRSNRLPVAVTPRHQRVAATPPSQLFRRRKRRRIHWRRGRRPHLSATRASPLPKSRRSSFCVLFNCRPALCPQCIQHLILMIRLQTKLPPPAHPGLETTTHRQGLYIWDQEIDF